MIPGLYSSAAAMAIEAMRPEAIASNLCNLNTYGYKEVLSSRSFEQALSAAELASLGQPFMRVWGGVLVDGSKYNLAQGSLTYTGNPLDLALVGDGFFCINTADGDRYTRGGVFNRDADGYLVTIQGDQVLGEDGPIQLDPGTVTVDSVGNISVDGTEVDRLKLVTFEDPEVLEAVGRGLYDCGSATPSSADNVLVRPGCLEESNVDVTTALVGLMTAQRSYETSLKLFQLQDSTLERAVNQVGRVT